MPVTANDGFSGANDANDRRESLNIDAEAAETEMPHELTEEEIAAAVQDLASFKVSDPMIENLSQQWATKNYSAALAFVVKLPAGEERDHLIQRVAFVQAQGSPLEAAQLVVAEIRPGLVQEEAVIMVVHQWALNDQGGAAAWVQRFPESKLRERAERELEGLKQFLSLHSS